MTSENNGMIMPVAPYYGGNGYANDGGMFGCNWMWFLLIWFAMFGWGGNGFGFGGGQNGYGAVQTGFDHQAVMTGINGILPAVQNGFAQAEIAANSRQMADMNQNFTMQSAFQNGLCETRLANANLMAAVAQEGATTRAASANDRQILMDKLNQIEMNDLKRDYEGQLRTMSGQLAAAQSEIAALRGDINRNALASQILANNEAQTTALEQYLAPNPRPAYIVQNPNCCGNGNGFGFGGCGGYAA